MMLFQSTCCFLIDIVKRDWLSGKPAVTWRENPGLAVVFCLSATRCLHSSRDLLILSWGSCRTDFHPAACVCDIPESSVTKGYHCPSTPTVLMPLCPALGPALPRHATPCHVMASDFLLHMHGLSSPCLFLPLDHLLHCRGCRHTKPWTRNHERQAEPELAQSEWEIGSCHFLGTEDHPIYRNSVCNVISSLQTWC